jgi:hypothetical protein
VAGFAGAFAGVCWGFPERCWPGQRHLPPHRSQSWLAPAHAASVAMTMAADNMAMTHRHADMPSNRRVIPPTGIMAASRDTVMASLHAATIRRNRQ